MNYANPHRLPHLITHKSEEEKLEIKRGIIKDQIIYNNGKMEDLENTLKVLHYRLQTLQSTSRELKTKYKETDRRLAYLDGRYEETTNKPKSKPKPKPKIENFSKAQINAMIGELSKLIEKE